MTFFKKSVFLRYTKSISKQNQNNKMSTQTLEANVKVIKTYIRDEKKVPFGVALMVKTPDGENHFGYSLVNKKFDKFDKKKGTKIALGRAMCGKPCYPSVEDRFQLVWHYRTLLGERI